MVDLFARFARALGLAPRCRVVAGSKEGALFAADRPRSRARGRPACTLPVEG